MQIGIKSTMLFKKFFSKNHVATCGIFFCKSFYLFSEINFRNESANIWGDPFWVHSFVIAWNYLSPKGHIAFIGLVSSEFRNNINVFRDGKSVIINKAYYRTLSFFYSPISRKRQARIFF